MHAPALTFLALITSGAALAEHDPLDAFPQPEAGFKRYVIALETKAQEDDFKVEVIAGKTLNVDCNRQHLGGDLTAHDLSGWGYTYYTLADPKGPMTTLMACPEQATKPAFVAMQGDGYVLRYNSKLPIVVYAPESLEVKYRIWSAEPNVHSASAR